MRCRLKRTLQIVAVCACVLVYANFFLATRSVLDNFGLDIAGRADQSGPQLDTLKKQKYHVSGLEPNGTQPNSSHLQTYTAAVPLKIDAQHVYPSLEFHTDDRIVSQLKFVPEPVQRAVSSGSEVKLKKILLYNGVGGWAVKRGQDTFLEQKCAVPHCDLVDSRASMSEADVVIFQGSPRSNVVKPPHQVWVLYLLESPYHTPNLGAAAGLINWTATYRHDSTIVAPYEKFVRYNETVLTLPLTKNYAEGKTKMIAWFVSNCGARNGRRQYADELAKYIQVDIYGNCGPLKCPRFQGTKCFDMLNKDYKFYLSFENSNCRDYITEKFFVNGLKHDLIPIVMGAAPEDYQRAAPPHSFIHVDDFESAKDLADYLHKLDQNDALYNEYFRWKGTGDIINTYFWCRVCALAHDGGRGHSWYKDVNSWWRGDGVCIGQDNWRQRPRTSKLIADLPVVEPPGA